MLSVGDAVLTFLGDTTQLDQVFAQLPAKTEAAMGAATGSVGQLGSAFQGVNFELDATASNVPYAGETIKDAMDTAGGSTRQAAAEAGLLGELFGIQLPRHVRTFLGELPGVGTALQSAFSATAVFFLVEALAQGIEKIITWNDAYRAAMLAARLDTENLTVAETSRTEGIALSNLKLEDQIAKLEGRPTTNKLAEALLEAKRRADDLVTSLAADLNKSEELLAGQSSNWETLKTGLQNVLAQGLTAAGTGAAVADTVALQNALQGVLDKLLAVDAARIKLAQADTEDQQKTAILELGHAYGQLETSSINAFNVANAVAPKNIDLIHSLNNGIIDATAGVKDMQLQYKNLGLAATEALESQANEAAKQGDAIFKRQAEAWKAGVDAEAKAQEDAYKRAVAAIQESEKEKIEATKQGTQARIAAIDDAIKDEESKGLQDTAFYKSLLTQRVEAVRAEVAAEQKAREGLSKAIEALDKANAAFQIESDTVYYDKRVSDINKLASLQVITETQKAQDLKALYQLEENDALRALDQTLADEKSRIAAAQSALGNPFLTNAEIADLEKNLAKAETDYIKTQTEILKIKQKFDKQYEAEDQALIKQATSSWKGFFQVLTSGSLKTSQELQAGFALITQGLGAAVAGAVEGSATFGQSMQKMAKSTLASLAEVAAVQALYSLGWAFYYLGHGDYVGATDMFTSAAEFSAVGGAAAVAGAAIPSGSGGAGGSATAAGTGTGTTSGAMQPDQQPVSVRNIQHLGNGLVLVPATAVVGPSMGSGTSSGAGALSGQDGDGGIAHVYVTVQGGIIDANTLKHVVRQVNQMVGSGKVRLNSSNSSKLTRRT